MTRVLCLISHGVYEPWVKILHEGQEVTWLKEQMPPGFQVVHFHGTPVGKFGQRLNAVHERIRWSTRLKAAILRYVDHFFGFPFRRYIPSVTDSEILNAKQQVLHVHQPDTYATYKWKEIGIFAHALKNYEFDFVFTTTTSSYIKPKTLINILSQKPTHRYYGGMIPYIGADFASGSNRIFSRDVIQLIVDKRNRLSCGIVEDVSVAKLLRENGILPDILKGLNLDSIEQLDSLSADEIFDNYHFRLKSGSLEKRNDVTLFKHLDGIIRAFN